jgi:exopolyphosphatase/guanosine-5'-triphosphate,3'-diphosphate pyrophosphatase
MRIAIIDCGTNTFNLLIAEKTENNIQFIFEKKISVKIGKGGIEKRTITPEAYTRALEAMLVYATLIKEYQVAHIMATSTSAFRSTDNGPQLKQDIFEQTGIEVNIITGDAEAQYIYQGVTWALPPQKDLTYLIMDIGGGSTEFILYRNEEILFKESYLLGASRLIEKLQPADPLAPDDLVKYTEYFNGLLQPGLVAACKKYPPEILVGSSGFFDTLRVICYYHFLKKDTTILTQTNTAITLREFEVCYELMLPMNLEERKQIKGMTDFRAEMMGVSMLLVDYVIKQTGVTSIINTSYALKEGVLHDYLNGIK